MKKIMDVNVWQVVKITKNLIPLIRHSHYDGRNRLVFHSSYLGRIMEPGNVPFSVSKMALEGICDSIRLENGKEFDVSVIEPGIFCQNSPYLISKSNFEKIQDRIYSEMSEDSKKLISKDDFGERLEYCTSRLNGFNNLDHVIDDYLHALFRFLSFMTPCFCDQQWSSIKRTVRKNKNCQSKLPIRNQ